MIEAKILCIIRHETRHLMKNGVINIR